MPRARYRTMRVRELLSRIARVRLPPPVNVDSTCATRLQKRCNQRHRHEHQMQGEQKNKPIIKPWTSSCKGVLLLCPDSLPTLSWRQGCAVQSLSWTGFSFWSFFVSHISPLMVSHLLETLAMAPARYCGSSVLSPLVLLFLFLSKALAPCYYPNGDLNDDLACDPSAAVSVCCHRNWTCLSNGLCGLTNSTGVVNYQRYSCTDRTWNSLACPQYCIAGTLQSARFRDSSMLTFPAANRQGSAIVYNCTYADNWCCDVSLVYGGCCSDPNNFLNIGHGYVVTQVRTAPSTLPTTVSTQSSGSTMSQSPSSSSTSVTTPPVIPSSSSTTAMQSNPGQPNSTSGQGISGTPSPSPKSSNSGAKVGAGVGVPAGLALVGALIYITYLTRRNRGNQRLLNGFADNQGVIEENKPRSEQPLSFSSTNIAPSEMAESNAHLGELTGTELSGQRR